PRWDSRAGDQSANPAAMRSPSAPRSQFSQGNVNVRFRCATTSGGKRSPSEAISSAFGREDPSLADSGSDRTHSTSGASRNGTRTSSEFAMLIESVSRSSVFNRYDRNSSQEICVKRSIERVWRAESESHRHHGRLSQEENSLPAAEANICGVKSRRVKKYS